MPINNIANYLGSTGRQIDNQFAANLVVNGGTEVEIQAAIDEADNIAKRYVREAFDTFTTVVIAPTVILQGEFTISNPIVLTQTTKIKGNSAYLIANTGSGGLGTDDYMFSGGGWKVKIEDLHILGAPNGIRMDTGSLSNNLAQGMASIKDVYFGGIPGRSLYIECRSNVVVVDQCEFDGVNQVCYSTMCDHLEFRNCDTRPKFIDPPWVHSHGKLIINGGIHTPNSNVDDELEKYWIELIPDHATGQESMVIANLARFGGEFGGAAIVMNKFKGLTSSGLGGPGVCIILENCNCHNVPNNIENIAGVDGPLILLEQVPNTIDIKGCIGEARKPIVGFANGVDGATLLQSFSTTGTTNRFFLKIQEHNRVSTAGGLVNPELEPFLVDYF